MDTYSGATWNKKAATAFYHQCVRATLQPRAGRTCPLTEEPYPRWEDTKHLVLASREGGDIPVLTALGIPVSNITAVDRSVDALEEFQRKHPNVESFHGEVEDLSFELLKRGRKFDHVFLDLCGYASPKNLNLLYRVMRNLVGHQGVFGFGMMRGRERSGVSRMITELDDSCESSSGLRSSETDGGAIVRALLVWDWIFTKVSTLGNCSFFPDLKFDLYYQGSVPMMYGFMQKFDRPSWLSAKQFFKTLDARPVELSTVEIAPESIESLLREIVSKFPDVAHDMLNISKASLAAHKAQWARSR